MADLLDLAARVEAADGADFDLDSEIALASGQYVREKRDRDRQEWFYPTGGRIERIETTPYGLGRLPRYTASLDAAMQLVPEGWRVNVIEEYEQGTWNATLRGPRDGDVRRYASARSPGAPAVATPALALCAAALRARASQ